MQVPEQTVRTRRGCRRGASDPLFLPRPSEMTTAARLDRAGRGTMIPGPGMAYSLDPKRFAQRVGTWLQGDGPDPDVVISCRVRLARNLDGYPFVMRLEDDKARELAGRVKEV